MEVELNIGVNEFESCSKLNSCESIDHMIYRAMRKSILNKPDMNANRTKENERSVILITNVKYVNFYVLILFIFVANLLEPVVTAKSSLRYNHKLVVRVLYQSGVSHSLLSF